MSEKNKYLEEIPNEYFKSVMRDAEIDIATGNVSPAFDTAEEAIKWLKKACNEKESRTNKTIYKNSPKITKENTETTRNKIIVVQRKSKQYNLKQSQA